MSFVLAALSLALLFVGVAGLLFVLRSLADRAVPPAQPSPRWLLTVVPGSGTPIDAIAGWTAALARAVESGGRLVLHGGPAGLEFRVADRGEGFEAGRGHLIVDCGGERASEAEPAGKAVGEAVAVPAGKTAFYDLDNGRVAVVDLDKLHERLASDDIEE
jgi:hypothetical protein